MKIRHEITFEQLHHLRKFSAAWGLLSSTMAPFVASFLYRIFIQTNRRSITVSEIVEALDNYLPHANQNITPKSFRQSVEKQSTKLKKEAS
jgi:DNA topoisomerase IA